MVEDGESKTDPRRNSRRRRRRLGKNRREKEGTGRHSIEDTREEMERGREGKNGGKGHWTVSFRNGY